MYRIVNITDKTGKFKRNTYEELRSIHPDLRGEIVNQEYIDSGIYLHFLWDDDSGRILRTSLIEEYIDKGNEIEFVTLNSIYTLEKVE